MQTLDIDRPGMPDLQFVLLVTALCTSRLTSLNVPDDVRTTLFDRCWVLIHENPPPEERERRVINLRPWSETTLDSMVETIRTVLTDAGIQTLSWDHSPSEPTWTSTPEALPLIQRLEQLYPPPSETPVHRPLTKAGSVTDTLSSTRKGNVSMDSEQAHLKQLIGEMSALMTAFSPALERRSTTFWNRPLVTSASKYAISAPAPSSQNPGLVRPSRPNTASPIQFGAMNIPKGLALKAALK